MPETQTWPPPEVKRLVIEELVDEYPAILDAEWPSPNETEQKIRALARQLDNHAQEIGGPLNEIYPIIVGYSRGGLEVLNKLARIFGYANRQTMFMGLSSYKEKGQVQGEFIRGQMPRMEDVEGLRPLAIDEVADTSATQLEGKKILEEELGAVEVATAVLDIKREKIRKGAGYIPDFWVGETEKWIVYYWDIYEVLARRALDETIWLPESARAELAQ